MSTWKDTALNFGLVIGLSQLLRLVDTENPTFVNIIRSVYVLSNLIFYFILYLCYLNIKKKADKKELSYIEQPTAFSEKPPVSIITTYQEYDQQELIKFARTSLISVAISVFIHLRMGYVQPIFIQSILPLKNIWNNPIVKIHFLNKTDEEGLRRPFKVQSNPFSGPATASTNLKKKNKIKKK